MWNDRKSVILSKCCVFVAMAMLLTVVIGTPWFFDGLLTRLSDGGMLRATLYHLRAYFMTTIYVGFFPAAGLLVSLFLLLHRIEKGRLFVRENTASLRHISWCCFAGAIVSLVSMTYWLPWLVIAIAAAFIGLIVRVIKNIFEKAVLLQDEADFTI